MPRILHVVGGMNRGGVQTWLMHVLRHIDRERFKMDFLVSTTQPCAYDEEIRALGSRVIPCLHPRRPWIYAHNFKRILRAQGPYDIIHSHVHHYSGFILRLARQSGVAVRIAHSHSDTSMLQANAGFTRRMYLAVMKRWIAHHATAGLAGSRPAAAALFGPVWESDHRIQLLHYSIDLSPFQIPIDSKDVRKELGIPIDAFVIGHVGRFHESKNHVFLLDIVAEAARCANNVRALLVGDGPLRPAIEQKIKKSGMTEYVIFAGSSSDVPRLMRGAMDVFLFPSLYEGLPLVLLEAQAAGLPCIISDVIPQEAVVVKPLVNRLSLAQPASDWADAASALIDEEPSVPPQECLAVLEKSPFNILTNIKELEDFYRGSPLNAGTP